VSLSTFYFFHYQTLFTVCGNGSHSRMFLAGILSKLFKWKSEKGFFGHGFSQKDQL